MIESKKLVPSYYSESRDYRVILKLLDYIVASHKGSVDDSVSLLVPKMCPKKYLSLLSEYVGYVYDSNIPEEVNRFIIGQYANLVRMRGSLNGIGFAVSLAIRAVQNAEQPMSKLFLIDKMYRILDDKAKEVYTNTELDSEETISIFLYADKYTHKIWDLVRNVRPAGINVVIDNSKLVDTSALTQQIDISAEIDKLFVQNGYNYKYSKDNGQGGMTNWTSGVMVNVKRQDIPVTDINNNIDNSIYDEPNKGNQSGTVGFVEVAEDE